MKRQTVIIYKSEVPECFGNLKLFCDSKGLKYNTYSRRKLPFEFDGYEVHRVPFQSGTIVQQAGGQNIKTDNSTTDD